MSSWDLRWLLQLGPHRSGSALRLSAQDATSAMPIVESRIVVPGPDVIPRSERDSLPPVAVQYLAGLEQGIGGWCSALHCNFGVVALRQSIYRESLLQ